MDVDAIPPDELQNIVTRAIASHVDADHYEKLRQIEAEERKSFRWFASVWRNEGAA